MIFGLNNEKIISNGDAYLKISLALPKEVTDFIEGSREILRSKEHYTGKEIPLASLDMGVSHGPDEPGLIFVESLKKTEPLGEGYEIISRCSFGWEREYEERNKLFLWSGSKFNRLHLSIKGKRKFIRQGDEGHGSYLTESDEKAQVSLRWSQGKFQTFWNDPKKRMADCANRMSYLEEGLGGSLLRDDFHGDESMRKGLIKGEARGYEPVLEFLAQFSMISPRDTESISRMNYREGTYFLLEQVLPAMEKFVKAQE